jgi:hypothetical protein
MVSGRGVSRARCGGEEDCRPVGVVALNVDQIGPEVPRELVADLFYRFYERCRQLGTRQICADSYRSSYSD